MLSIKIRKVLWNLQWDILTDGFLVQEMAHIATGRDPGNFVSLLHANVSWGFHFAFGTSKIFLITTNNL